MCKYHSKFNEFMTELNDHRALLSGELSRLDKIVSRLYHELEGLEPSEEFALSFVVQLHSVLKKRRVIKDEMARLDTVLRPVRNIAEEVEESVSNRKQVSRRWRRDFKMTLNIEQVISKK